MNKRSVHFLFCLAALALVFVLIAVPAAGVSAIYRTCRTDPIVTLSDKSKITVTSDIETGQENVVSLQYLLHVPTGLTVEEIAYPDGALDGRETMEVVADNTDNQYFLETWLTTSEGEGTVAITTNIVVKKGKKGDSLSVDGVSGQVTTMMMQPAGKPAPKPEPNPAPKQNHKPAPKPAPQKK